MNTVLIRRLHSTDGWRDLEAVEVVVNGVHVGGGMFETEEPDAPGVASPASMPWVTDLIENMALALQCVPSYEDVELPVEAFLDRVEE